MKTRIIFWMTFVIFGIFFSCNTEKKTTKTPELSRPEPEVAKLKLVLWDNDPNIANDSHMAFYNEFEINIVGTIPNFVYEIRDGKQVRIDNGYHFDFRIPKGTPGSLIENGVVRNSKGQVTAVKVKHLQDNDCWVIYSVEKGKAVYFLETQAVVVFNGKEYFAPVSIDSEGTGMRCRVLNDEGDEDNSSKVDETAKGNIIHGVQKIP